MGFSCVGLMTLARFLPLVSKSWSKFLLGQPVSGRMRDDRDQDNSRRQPENDEKDENQWNDQGQSAEKKPSLAKRGQLYQIRGFGQISDVNGLSNHRFRPGGGSRLRPDTAPVCCLIFHEYPVERPAATLAWTPHDELLEIHNSTRRILRAKPERGISQKLRMRHPNERSGKH